MSKQSRNRRRIDRALAITTTERLDAYGVDMDDRTGIPVDDVRSVGDWIVMSSALHSRSLGWIPALVVTVTHHPSSPTDPDQEPRTIKLAITGREAMLDIVQGMNIALDHALLDASAGFTLR